MEMAPRFKVNCKQMTFGDRISYTRKLHGSEQLRPDPAREIMTRRNAGYCIGSVSADWTGEADLPDTDNGLLPEILNSLSVSILYYANRPVSGLCF